MIITTAQIRQAVEAGQIEVKVDKWDTSTATAGDNYPVLGWAICAPWGFFELHSEPERRWFQFDGNDDLRPCQRKRIINRLERAFSEAKRLGKIEDHLND